MKEIFEVLIGTFIFSLVLFALCALCEHLSKKDNDALINEFLNEDE